MWGLFDWIAARSITELDAYVSFIVNAGLILMAVSSVLVALFKRIFFPLRDASGFLGIGNVGWFVILIASLVTVMVIARIANPPIHKISREDGERVDEQLVLCREQGLDPMECVRLCRKNGVDSTACSVEMLALAQACGREGIAWEECLRRSER